jgi:hypothetical protein
MAQEVWQIGVEPAAATDLHDLAMANACVGQGDEDLSATWRRRLDVFEDPERLACLEEDCSLHPCWHPMRSGMDVPINARPGSVSLF